MFNEAVYDAAQIIKSELQTSQNEKTTTEKISGSGDYSLNVNASKNVDKALNDIKFRGNIRLTDNTPTIISSQKGAENLPMVMKSSHVRQNILTEAEALAKGLKVDEDTHYHGLGKELFLKVINDLDNVKLAYRGTKNAEDSARRENYFLLISQYKDTEGNVINVPIFITKSAKQNEVHFFANQIATVFGRENILDYIQNQIRKGNLVRIKNRSTSVSERTALLAGGYNKSTSTNSIHPEGEAVNNNLSDEGGDYSINLNKTREDALDLLEGKISLDEYVEKQEKINKSRESRIRRTVKSERNKFKGFSGSVIDLQRGVKEILGISDSTYDKESLKNEMGALLSLSDRKNINQDTVSIIRASCEQIAQAVVEQSKAWHIRSEDSQEMLDVIKGIRI